MAMTLTYDLELCVLDLDLCDLDLGPPFSDTSALGWN